MPLSHVAPGPEDLAADAHGADIEPAFLSVDLESEGVVVDHERFAGLVRIARHGHERACIVGWQELEQSPAGHGIALETVVFGGRDVCIEDGEVGDLAGAVAPRGEDEMRIE